MKRHGSRYTYYHCSRRRLDYRCQQLYIRVEELERQIVQFLMDVTIPDRIHTWLLAKLDRVARSHATNIEAQQHSVERAKGSLDREMNNLTKLRLRDLISDDEFLRQRSELEQEEIRVAQSLERLQRGASWFEPARNLASFNRGAVSGFLDGDLHARRFILETVGSNLSLLDEKLRAEAKKPFRRWTETDQFTTWRGAVEDIRSFVLNPASQPILARMREFVQATGLPKRERRRNVAAARGSNRG